MNAMRVVQVAALLMMAGAYARAQVYVEVRALGDGGKVFLGQPAYADVVFTNRAPVDLPVAAGAPVGLWEVQTPQGTVVRCVEESASVPSDEEAKALWLKAGEIRTVRGIVLQNICAGALNATGSWKVRVSCAAAASPQCGSGWRAIEVRRATGHEAEGIERFPHGAVQIDEYLQRYGDTAVAGELLRTSNDRALGGAWLPELSFAQRAAQAAENSVWKESLKAWRLPILERFLKLHPESYFAPELQSILGAMYVATGEAAALAQLSSKIQRRRPAEAAAMAEVAKSMLNPRDAQ